MKKFLAMILSIMLLALPCASLADADAAAETNADAAAETDADVASETDATGEAIEFTYDPDVIAQAGLEGEFVSLADMGILFQFFLPNTLTAQDLTEDQAATGAIALFVNEDATNSMSIGYGMAVDAEGNTVTTLEELNAAYASAGCEDMEYATINGIPCMSYSIKASDVGGVAFLFDDGTQLTFNFSPASDENFAVATYAILSSIMPVEDTEAAA